LSGGLAGRLRCGLRQVLEQTLKLSLVTLEVARCRGKRVVGIGGLGFRHRFGRLR